MISFLKSALSEIAHCTPFKFAHAFLTNPKRISLNIYFHDCLWFLECNLYGVVRGGMWGGGGVCRVSTLMKRRRKRRVKANGVTCRKVTIWKKIGFPLAFVQTLEMAKNGKGIKQGRYSKVIFI